MRKLFVLIGGCLGAAILWLKEHPEAVAGTSSKTTYTAAGAAAAFGLTATEWTAVGVMGSLIIGCVTAYTNYYFRRKSFNRGEK